MMLVFATKDNLRTFLSRYLILYFKNKHSKFKCDFKDTGVLYICSILKLIRRITFQINWNIFSWPSTACLEKHYKQENRMIILCICCLVSNNH